jgi:NADH:ubiquinone oxidoreductase subunit C
LKPATCWRASQPGASCRRAVPARPATSRAGSSTASVLVDLCRDLRDGKGTTRFDLLLEVFGMDYPDRGDERFEVVYHLYSLPFTSGCGSRYRCRERPAVCRR